MSLEVPGKLLDGDTKTPLHSDQLRSYKYWWHSAFLSQAVHLTAEMGRKGHQQKPMKSIISIQIEFDNANLLVTSGVRRGLRPPWNLKQGRVISDQVRQVDVKSNPRTPKKQKKLRCLNRLREA